ncbi:hypothetical protein KM043_008173 [Ampulex compressa]|nr:hypothetical protein KM043_008173 [Ampulex compressa]
MHRETAYCVRKFLTAQSRRDGERAGEIRKNVGERYPLLPISAVVLARASGAKRPGRVTDRWTKRSHTRKLHCIFSEEGQAGRRISSLEFQRGRKGEGTYAGAESRGGDTVTSSYSRADRDDGPRATVKEKRESQAVRGEEEDSSGGSKPRVSTLSSSPSIVDRDKTNLGRPLLFFSSTTLSFARSALSSVRVGTPPWTIRTRARGNLPLAVVD